MPSLKVGSLFSGAGLCDLGLTWAGFHHQWFCEVEPVCRTILARHWPDVPVYGDIRTINGRELPAVDVLAGGFPCQDVSLGGVRAGIGEGTRSGLWIEFRRIISEARPRWVIIENVRGLLSCGMDVVLRGLAEIGYDAEWEVLPAAALGAPHHRERVFLVAYPDSGGGDASEPDVLSALPRILGEREQPWLLSDWLGLRFDRMRKSSALEAYPGPVIYRMDDGRSDRLDVPGRTVSRARVPSVTAAEARAWLPRLKALGNAITPQQAYAVAACILMAEGLPVPPLF